MHIRRRTVSETETHRLVTVRGHSILAWCQGCEQEVEMVAVERAEDLLGATVPSLRQREKLWVCRRWLRHPRGEH